jgi:hypothetical protein
MYPSQVGHHLFKIIGFFLMQKMLYIRVFMFVTKLVLK